MVHRVLDAGVNLIDTADRYDDGRSEEILGRAIRGRRDDVVIATKCGFGPPARGPGGLAYENVIAACEASLRRLDVDVIDRGPGIPDVEQAMRDGFSTASAEARALGFGAGMGLPNIERNSDRLRVTSTLGEGTCVSFSIVLAPQQTEGEPRWSLDIVADRCRDCRRCIVACPTNAVRVRAGVPSVLQHLCIDCTCCLAACPPEALTLQDAAGEAAGFGGGGMHGYRSLEGTFLGGCLFSGRNAGRAAAKAAS